MSKAMKILTAAALAVTMLAGCGSSAGGTSADGKESVRLMVWSGQKDQAADSNYWLQTSCEDFAALHPEWDITFVYGVVDNAADTAEPYIRACYEAQELFNPSGFAATVIENHDNPRGVSRFIPAEDLGGTSKKMFGALYFFMKGLPCIYQGQELGMENYPFSSIEEMDDVSAKNEYEVALKYGLSEAEALAAAAAFSRDNARTPMQWSGGYEAGFTTGTPWLRVNPNFVRVNAEDEEADPGSVLHFYRRMLALRKDPAYRETFVYGSFEPVRTGRL